MEFVLSFAFRKAEIACIVDGDYHDCKGKRCTYFRLCSSTFSGWFTETWDLKVEKGPSSPSGGSLALWKVGRTCHLCLSSSIVFWQMCVKELEQDTWHVWAQSSSEKKKSHIKISASNSLLSYFWRRMREYTKNVICEYWRSNPGSVFLGKILKLSKSSFSHLLNGNDKDLFHRVVKIIHVFMEWLVYFRTQ